MNINVCFFFFFFKNLNSNRILRKEKNMKEKKNMKLCKEVFDDYARDGEIA